MSRFQLMRAVGRTMVQGRLETTKSMVLMVQSIIQCVHVLRSDCGSPHAHRKSRLIALPAQPRLGNLLEILQHRIHETQRVAAGQ